MKMMTLPMMPRPGAAQASVPKNVVGIDVLDLRRARQCIPSCENAPSAIAPGMNAWECFRDGRFLRERIHREHNDEERTPPYVSSRADGHDRKNRTTFTNHTDHGSGEIWRSPRSSINIAERSAPSKKTGK